MPNSHTLAIPKLRRDVGLAPFTTYKIGGPADYFVEVKTQHALAEAILAAQTAQIPYFLLGSGANILISDEGFRGLVIRNLVADASISGATLTAGSGATIADLIKLTQKAGLSGLEHFVLIPSSVGGAIWQNLHFASVDAALWKSTGELKSNGTIYISEIVKGARILTDSGEYKSADAAFFEFGYDTSILHYRRLTVLEVSFQLTPKSPAAIALQMKANSAWRRAKQPQLEDFASGGSIFKKIEGVGAGRLIDQVGLKGFTIGGAQISPLHANYFVNLGHATAADVIALLKRACHDVFAETGYQLEPEIDFIGFSSNPLY